MTRLTAVFMTLLIFAAAAMHGAARSQPTGNPKGSVAPSTQGNSEKAPANPARNVDTGRSDRLDEQKGPVDARTRRTERPGGGSTTGGLTRRNPQEANPPPSPAQEAADPKEPRR
uniref:hypothetical protein n=1 Tax=Variovorax sp. BK018 TaxID=3450241 RepID=UPI004039B5F3